MFLIRFFFGQRDGAATRALVVALALVVTGAAGPPAAPAATAARTTVNAVRLLQAATTPCLGPLVAPGAPAAGRACGAFASPVTPGIGRSYPSRMAQPPQPVRCCRLPKKVSLIKTIILAGAAAGVTGLIVWARAKGNSCAVPVRCSRI